MVDSKDVSHVRISIDSLLLHLMMAFSILYCVGLPFNSIVFRHVIMFAGSICFYIIAIRRLIVTRYNILQFLLLGLILSILFFHYLFGSDKDYIELIYVSFNFISLLAVFATENHFFLSDKNKKTVFKFAIISVFLLLLVSNTNVAYLTESGITSEYLVLGMTNSNLTGMILFALYGFLFVNYRKGKNIKFNFLVLIIALYLLFLTGARSSIISAVLLTVYGLFFYKYRFPLILVKLMVLLPLLIIPLYLFLYSFLPSDYTLLGKPFFSGRELIFSNILFSYELPLDILFGDLNSSKFANATNMPLTIYLSVGLIGFLATFYIFFKRLVKESSTLVSYDSKIAFFCILCFFIQSSAEAYMFTGTFPGSFYMYIYILLLSNKTVSP